MIIDNLATLPVTIQLSINGVEIINFFLLSRVLICIDTSVLVHHPPPPPPHQHQCDIELLTSSHLALPAFSVSTHSAEGEGDERSVRIFTILISLCLTICCHLWRDFASAVVLIYTSIIETFIQFMLIYFQEGWREGWISAPVLNFDKPRQVPS